MKVRVVLVVVIVVMVQAGSTLGWGSSICNIIHQDKEWLSQLSTESTQRMNQTIAGLDNKLDAMMSVVEELKTQALAVGRYRAGESDSVEREDRSNNRNSRRNDSRNRRDHDDEDRKRRDHDDEDRKRRDYDNDGRNRKDNDNEDRNRRDRDDEYRNRRDRDDQGRDGRDRDDEYRNRRDRDDQGRDMRDSDDENRDRWESDEDRNNSDSEDRNRRDRDEDDNDPEARVKKGECIALTLDNHETIGKFFMSTYNHGHCANRDPIAQPVRYCLGYCETRTFVEREHGIWSQGSDCQSCQPESHETLNIPLACDDGFTFEKVFENVVTCKCRKCNANDN